MMIISGLLNLIYSVLSFLLVFELPNMPDTILTILNQIIGYFQTGIQVISAFIGSTAIGVIALLIQLVIFLNAAYFLWSFVFWVIRKIPMLNVRE